jgi:probable HAF family extracellular repeat protein
VNVSCPYGSGRPYCLALSSFHPPNISIAVDSRGVGGSRSEAQDINDIGLVVGNSYTTGDAEYRATLWNGSGPIDLGTLGGTNSVAHAINVAGIVVGYSGTSGNTATHATLWDGTAVVDLNTLLDASTISDGWVLLHAYDINDNGWIVGIAENSITGDANSAFLLTPTAVPIPAALWLFGSGLLGLIGLARKKA